jgi:hypothetical protein
VGSQLDIQSGRWTDEMAGIGAGSDSYYEYLLKAYVAFGNPRYLRMFEVNSLSLSPTATMASARRGKK